MDQHCRAACLCGSVLEQPCDLPPVRPQRAPRAPRPQQESQQWQQPGAGKVPAVGRGQRAATSPAAQTVSAITQRAACSHAPTTSRHDVPRSEDNGTAGMGGWGEGWAAGDFRTAPAKRGVRLTPWSSVFQH